MKARKILLLLVVLAFGGGVEVAWSVRQHLHIGPAACRVLGGKFYGPSFSFESTARKEVQADTSLELENAFGGVQITAGAPGEVHAVLRTVVFQPTQERARSFASKVRLEAALEGSTLRLRTNRKQLDSRDVGFETHFDVQVPPGTRVAVKNEHGRVEIADVAEADVENSYDTLRATHVAGRASLRNRHGDLEAASIGGTLSLSCRYGDVNVRDVAGKATIEVAHGGVSVSGASGLSVVLRYGDLHAEGIRGDVDARGEHAGVVVSDVAGAVQVETTYQDVRVSKVSGDVRLKAQHGELEAAEIAGALVAEVAFNDANLSGIGGPVDVKVDHGGLRAQGLSKGARIRTLGDDVVLDGFRGAIDIEARRGSVHLIPEGALTDAVSVGTTNGGIVLEVPAGSRFELAASAAPGEVEASVPGLSLSQSGSSRITGSVGGGGSLVRLNADHGDVRIEPRAAVASRQDR